MPTSHRRSLFAASLALVGLATAACWGLVETQALAEGAAEGALLQRLSDEGRALEVDTARLTAELSALRQLAQTSTDSGVIAPTQAARFELRLNAIEEALRRTTGQVETFDFRLQQLDARLTGLDERLQAAERQLLETESVPEPVAETSEGEAPAEEEAVQETAAFVPESSGSTIELPAGSPEEQYDFAFGLLRQAKYADAQSALEQFLAGNAEHGLAGNAKYWLGETFYVRGDYQSSALIFAEAYRQYPDSQKAPDNLLKLGMSLSNLGDKENACGTLSELLRIYPRAASSIRARAEREMQLMGCS